MFVGNDDFKVLLGMLSAWKDLPVCLIEILSIATVATLGLGWSFGICFLLAAPITFLKLIALRNPTLLLPAAIYSWAKWPVRIASLYFIASSSPSAAWFLVFVFIGGSKLLLAPWNILFNRYIASKLDGQHLDYRALQLLAEQRFGVLSQPLLYLPLKLPTGETFDQVSEALMEAAEETDRLRKAMIIASAVSILGKSEAINMTEAFQRASEEGVDQGFAEIPS